MKGSHVTVTKGTRPGRADQLGSTPRTIIVRCPCGRRNYFDRQAWQWFEVAFCVRCRQAILYVDLRVISRWEGERMLREQTIYEGELKALRTGEVALRHFLEQFAEKPRWEWPLSVVRHAQAAQVSLQLAERARARQGAEPEVPFDEEVRRLFLEKLNEEAAHELTPEQIGLLAAYSRLPEERRADMLAYIEQEGIEL
jgi:hypothetical protein